MAPRKNVMQIDAEYFGVNGIGTEEDFKRFVEGYTKQLEEHAKSTGVPAPVAHPLVETCVKRYGGKYKLVNVPKPAPEPKQDETPGFVAIPDRPPDPPRNLDIVDVRDQKYAELGRYRYGIQRRGITLKGTTIGCENATIADLDLKLRYGDPSKPFVWKVALGEFVKLNHDELAGLIMTMQRFVQDLYNREAELAHSISRLQTVDEIDNFIIREVW